MKYFLMSVVTLLFLPHVATGTDNTRGAAYSNENIQEQTASKRYRRFTKSDVIDVDAGFSPFVLTQKEQLKRLLSNNFFNENAISASETVEMFQESARQLEHSLSFFHQTSFHPVQMPTKRPKKNKTPPTKRGATAMPTTRQLITSRPSSIYKGIVAKHPTTAPAKVNKPKFHSRASDSPSFYSDMPSRSTVAPSRRHQHPATHKTVTPTRCSAHSKCVVLGLKTGKCCPDATGVMQTCCDATSAVPFMTARPNKSPQTAPHMTILSKAPSTEIGKNHTHAGSARCSVYSKCVVLGLKGQCCPDAMGVFQDCCNSNITLPAPPSKAQPAPPSKKPPTTAAGGKGKNTTHVSGSARCSANSKCVVLGMKGHCCPDTMGVFQDCCNATSALPASPSKAPPAPPIKTPPTTPTSGKGKNATHDAGSARCSVNSKCVVLGLKGHCCPDATGVFQTCCDATGALPTSPSMVPPAPPKMALPTAPILNPPAPPKMALPTAPTMNPPVPPKMASPTAPTRNPPVPPSNLTLTKPASCSSSSSCAALGLTGDCCPDSNGIYLNCCSNTFTPPATSPTVNSGKRVATSKCSAFTGCAALHLTGDCCPNGKGVFLKCCSATQPPAAILAKTNDPSNCSAHSSCAALGLVGQCCPADSGHVMDCCNKNSTILPSLPMFAAPGTVPTIGGATRSPTASGTTRRLDQKSAGQTQVNHEETRSQQNYHEQD